MKDNEKIDSVQQMNQHPYKDLIIEVLNETIYLTLKWKIQADQATCFQIFKLHDGYIVHGELLITKLDRDGNKKWEFGGADIFVSIDNAEVFKMDNDGILLSDFSGNIYKIDFDGDLLSGFLS